jgi:signal recognition particle subunit SRP54
MVRKLGPIGNLLGMLPGAAQNREMLSQVSDKDLDRAAAIVNSMTPAERRNPKIINGSRRARIAAGSGVTVGEVSSLITRFQEAQKMMRQVMGMPGLRRGAQKASRKGKKKPKGGRPGGVATRPAAGSRPGGGPAGLPASPGHGPMMPGSIPGLPDGFGGGAGDGGFKLPPGFGTPQPNLPPGLRGPVPNRRGRPGKKGR